MEAKVQGKKDAWLRGVGAEGEGVSEREREREREGGREGGRERTKTKGECGRETRLEVKKVSGDQGNCTKER